MECEMWIDDLTRRGEELVKDKVRWVGESCV